MATVYHEPEFTDEYSKDIISRIRQLSPELNEYVITESYLLEANADEITSLWLRNRLLLKVIDQLSDRGIRFDRNSDDLLDAPMIIDAILTLRSKFDNENFYDLLKTHPSIREAIVELLDDDCIGDVITCCNGNLPLDEGWESLQKLIDLNPDLLFSDKNFVNLIQDTLDRVERLGDEEAVAESDMDKMLGYTKYLSERKVKITKIAATIYAADDKTGARNQDKFDLVFDVMSEFEKQLSFPGVIRKYVDGEWTVKNFVEQIRNNHLHQWRHCLEYYVTPEHQQLIPSDLEAAIMIATLYVDAPDPEHARVHVVETFDNMIDQLGDRYSLFRDIIDRMIGNIIIVEGELSHAVD